MKRFLLIALLCIHASACAQRITISGFIKEAKSQEQLPGASVYIAGSPYGVESNTYGFYSLTIPMADSAVVTISCVGYQKQERTIRINGNEQLNVWLVPDNQLNEVVVKTHRDDPLSSVQMSQINVPIQQIRKIPAIFGEKDVLKVLQLMPGVQKGTEGQTGLYVRGGGPDQNLIILDDAVVYNANHLFGFFSVFNSDAIKSVELTKGGFPARYGGRLSSVVEMHMKEGSKDQVHGEGGIGLIASRLTLEGPIRKNKSSFLISARRTYLDIIAMPFISMRQKGTDEKAKLGYYFYDLNAKVNFDLGKTDKLYVSSYFGRDKYYERQKNDRGESSAGLNWGNATATLRWNHLFSQRLFMNTSVIASNFRFGVSNYTKEKPGAPASDRAFELKYASSIHDIGWKTDFDFYPSPRHSVKFGGQLTFHRFLPSAMVIEGSFSENPVEQSDPAVSALETGLYIEDTWQPFDILKLNMGLRFTSFKVGKKNYHQPEPRLSTALRLSKNLSLKASYAYMTQYVHLLSNTGLGLPTDLWVPSTDRLAPQRSRQVALGIAKNLQNPALTLTLESYYKNMSNILNYKEGASFLRINGDNARALSWQDNITDGKGWSYGAELLLQRKTGRLSGWIGYTLSWTFWKFPELNQGNRFFPRYDRRHDVSLVGIYELNDHITLSSTWVYGTGNAVTLPVATFTGAEEYLYARFDPTDATNDGFFDLPLTEYDGVSNFRGESYHRLDLAIQFRKKKKKYERTWEVAVYNVYNRKNPFFYNMKENFNSDTPATERFVLTKYSLFPVMPSVSYNFKF
ncbi:Outer membrane receptor proteins, mostly Fe transport [Dyadobacter soli]|uniref:Outer membrane receptor proteins, mostly Fe transport n=1 Tax=Dyadobacter soli TaxID=659014 RepID=A0A1G7DE13_9BACT|nr:TonB-dependent receptor [Dyadobacter soli]SDE49226.1 Outer membrane receptor proteins, mostly Fe transport [Dyadobacter soli]